MKSFQQERFSPALPSSRVVFSFVQHCQTTVEFLQTSTTSVQPSPVLLLPSPCWLLFSLQMVLKFCKHSLPLPAFFSSSWWLTWCLLSFGVFAFSLFRRFTSACEESLLVISGVGVQLRTTLRSGRRRHYFVDAAHLQQGFVGLQVLNYLAFVVKDADRTIIPFECFPPRLPTLVFIYNIVYPLLFVCPCEAIKSSEPNKRKLCIPEGQTILTTTGEDKNFSKWLEGKTS
eukprot:GHVS01067844.1.p1 GENE.GHVS01067844.1~~GHVS01067844.1.p1  ORF type:complete len:230 (+),score=44.13 GHVS01067844.1:69-758(+)